MKGFSYTLKLASPQYAGCVHHGPTERVLVTIFYSRLFKDGNLHKHLYLRIQDKNMISTVGESF